MVTDFVTQKESAKRARLGWLAVVVAVLIGAFATAAKADGLWLPDDLLNEPKKKPAPVKPAPAKPAAPVENVKPAPAKPVVQPAKPAPVKPAEPAAKAPAQPAEPPKPTLPKVPVVPEKVTQAPQSEAFLAMPPRPKTGPVDVPGVTPPTTPAETAKPVPAETAKPTIPISKQIPPGTQPATPIPSGLKPVPPVKPAIESDEPELNPVDAVDPNDRDEAGLPTCNGPECAPKRNLMDNVADLLDISGKKVVEQNRAARLAQAALAAAARCRDFADFKEVRMGIAKFKTVRIKGKLKRVQIAIQYNSCKFFGGKNWLKSKGMCARGTREALAEIGVKVQPGHAYLQRPRLLKAGFKRIAYKPESVPAGTVLVCNGGGSGYGHMEVAVNVDGRRMYCSDFCAVTPTCTKAKGYSKAEAYALPSI